MNVLFAIFFFQAEDGIRAIGVTGVQTCALPILAIRAKRAGVRRIVVLERAETLGGTWRDNRYPGCACDVPTPLYSYSFALNPDWSRLYAPQAEILEYLRRVATDYGVLPRIRFSHELCQAAWDEKPGHWVLDTSQGRWTADV